MAVRQSGLAEVQNNAYAGVPTMVAGNGTQDPVTMLKPYLYALRRRSLLAFGLALIAATIVAPLVWYLVPTTYTAEHYLRVTPHARRIMFDPSAPGERVDFALWRNTQQQIIRSPFVVFAALREPAIAQLRTIREIQAKGEDPVQWLQDNIEVTFPGGSQIMRISVSDRDPHDVTQLVLAVAGAYLREVVHVEQQESRQRLDELDRLFAQKVTELRTAREQLRREARMAGASEDQDLPFKTTRTLQDYSALRRQQMQIQFELLRARSELKSQQGALERLAEVELPGIMLARYERADPGLQQLASQLAYFEQVLEQEANAVVPGAAEGHLQRRRETLATLEERYQQERQRLLEDLRVHREAAAEEQIGQLISTIRTLEEHEKAIAAEVDRARAEAEGLGASTVDVEMMRVNVAHLEQVIEAISSERERLGIEVDGEARVTELMRARMPTTPDRHRRIPLAVLAGLFAFGLPLFCVAWWDIRSGRINEADEVSKGLGLTVLGLVPVIPHRVITRLDSPSKRNREWQARLTEAVDGIMARLLRKASTHDMRTVLVTSAITREGKTTLATQVAMSLARNGHRTLLADFDLRRPTLHHVFGFEAEPGINEVIRSECKLGDAVKRAGNRLSFLPAGRWDRAALAALTNGAAEHLLRELRGDYDFVVLDSSPILPVADTRFVSQHVDLVMLSVMRDRSSAPKMQAACEILDAFGAKHVETVVIGPGSSPHYYEEDHHPEAVA